MKSTHISKHQHTSLSKRLVKGFSKNVLCCVFQLLVKHFIQIKKNESFKILYFNLGCLTKNMGCKLVSRFKILLTRLVIHFGIRCSWIRNLSGLRPWGFLNQKHLIPQCITITYMIKLRGTTAHLALNNSGADPGGAPGACLPPKIVKNMIFWRKIVIFHTKYPKNFRASLRSAQFFQVRPP
jgi:hypothetical protein